MIANAQKSTLTTTGAQMEMGCSSGPAHASLHAWQIHNNSTGSAVVRPEGSLLEALDPDAADFWNELGSADTTILTGETALIEIPDTLLARVRINVKTLPDNNVIVKQVSSALDY